MAKTAPSKLDPLDLFGIAAELTEEERMVQSSVARLVDEKVLPIIIRPGALGTVIVLLVWLYITGLVLIMGGEINAIVDRVHHGIAHTEKEPGPTTTHDPRPIGDGENRPRARRR